MKENTKKTEDQKEETRTEDQTEHAAARKVGHFIGKAARPVGKALMYIGIGALTVTGVWAVVAKMSGGKAEASTENGEESGSETAESNGESNKEV